MRDTVLSKKVRSMLSLYNRRASATLDWLAGSMHPYFFITMHDEVETIANLARTLQPKERSPSQTKNKSSLLLASTFPVPYTILGRLLRIERFPMPR